MKEARRKHKIRKLYKVSIIEGSFAQIYGNLALIGSSFITKFMVILQASPLQFSFLSALGQLSGLWQPLGLAFSHRFERRKWPCIWITALGRMLTVFLGLALLFPSNQKGIWFALSLLFVSAGLQSTGGNIWIAWISDMIPVRIRGRFFSKRNQIHLIIGLVFSYVLSYHVDLFESAERGVKYISMLKAQNFFIPQNQGMFLAFIFIFASLLGVFGLWILSLQPERTRKLPEQSLKSLYREPFKDKNFRLLLVFGSWWFFATGVGSPFWTPFMLRNLEMGLFDVQIYSTLHMGASLLSFSFWGRFIDKFGNKTAMKICVLLGGINPLLWLFVSPGNYHLLWLEALGSGFMWAGSGIVTTNFVLSIAPKGSEQGYSGMYAAITGTFMMISTLGSGIFYPPAMTIGKKLLAPEQITFLVGAFMRWAAIIPLIMVREKHSVSLRKALAFSMGGVLGLRNKFGKKD